jgi:hypothetical protein
LNVCALPGPDENEITDVPSLAGYLQLTKLDWQYKTEPTAYACLGFKKKRCSWPRGKVTLANDHYITCPVLFGTEE